jgi:hypothetical protein
MKRLFLKIKKKLHPTLGEKVTRSERYTIMSALKLMKLPDTELTIHPSKDKYYIKSGDDRIWIKIDNYPPNVTIVNHKFQYDVKFSERAMSILQDRFIEVTEKRRDRVEKMFLSNTENSLRSIYNGIDQKEI